MKASTDKMIEKYFNPKWDFIDFFYAYCSNKGIDDPENDLTEEEYDELWAEAEKFITYNSLNDLYEAVIQDVSERIMAMME